MIRLPSRLLPLVRRALRHRQGDRRPVGVGVIQRRQHRAAQETVTARLPVERLPLDSAPVLFPAAVCVKPAGLPRESAAAAARPLAALESTSAARRMAVTADG